MPNFEPTRPDATFHTCERCKGEGYISDDEECPDCDGTGEWFE